MRLLLFLLLISCSYSAVGQDLTNYQPLECQGPIPDAFIIPSAEKYRRESDLIHQESADELERKDKSDFALQVNFALDDILQSGLILYNDPIGAYLQEVMNSLHASSGSPGTPPEVYIVRTPGVNAFATDRGSVFVTMGLLSQLENEAQLAFILAHELVHYEKRHSRELFLEAVEMEREMGSGPLEEMTIDEVLVSKNYYSKELESEADADGLDKML
ncbi:MAG: M48 family metallopeptidase, partial [Phaeodactylibacter sp.]|nr:M48 family metallopeptidase [Phaeodactylibacter sp.]